MASRVLRSRCMFRKDRVVNRSVCEDVVMNCPVCGRMVNTKVGLDGLKRIGLHMGDEDGVQCEGSALLVQEDCY